MNEVIKSCAVCTVFVMVGFAIGLATYKRALDKCCVNDKTNISCCGICSCEKESNQCTCKRCMFKTK